MAIDLEDEILQDFLVEAAEILEQMNEQLIELEKSPEDSELLNSIFRGFHTVKGGAGFLALDGMVGVCHIAEDVFDVLRNGDRVADAALMDVILRALDVINEMFESVRVGEDPEPADPVLIAEIAAFKSPAGTTPEPVEVEASEAVVAHVEAAPAAEVTDVVQQEFEAMLKSAASPELTPVTAASSDDISEEEFENLLDELHGKGSGPSAAPVLAPSDDISEEEFENLLDELHGKGKGPSVEVVTSPEVKAPDSGDMTEAEFDKLMDDMHGKGKGPTSVSEVVEIAPPRTC